MNDVKAPPKRTPRERANTTKRNIVNAAYELFCEQGYPLTTMETIAVKAGVAVQTVYYVFRTKAALLRDVIETAATAPPVAQRPWVQQALATSDGYRALALTIEHGVDIYARVAPLETTIKSAAAADPDVDDYWRSVTEVRRAGMERLVSSLAANRQLRSGMDLQRATDILAAIYSHATFLALTHDAGWTITEFKAWLFETLSHQLIAATPSHNSAAKDLSFFAKL